MDAPQEVAVGMVDGEAGRKLHGSVRADASESPFHSNRHVCHVSRVMSGRWKVCGSTGGKVARLGTARLWGPLTGLSHL
jgi:hypothetical protein